MSQVRRLCRLFGWRVYHTRFSIGSDPGFPDLVLVKPPHVIFVELKTQTGVLTPYQKEWLGLLAECEAPPATAVWRPNDVEAVVATLQLINPAIRVCWLPSLREELSCETRKWS